MPLKNRTKFEFTLYSYCHLYCILSTSHAYSSLTTIIGKTLEQNKTTISNEYGESRPNPNTKITDFIISLTVWVHHRAATHWGTRAATGGAALRPQWPCTLRSNWAAISDRAPSRRRRSGRRRPIPRCPWHCRALRGYLWVKNGQLWFYRKMSSLHWATNTR